MSTVQWLDAATAEYHVRTPQCAETSASWWCVVVGHFVIVLHRDRRTELRTLRERIVAMSELEHGVAARAHAATEARMPEACDRATLESVLLPLASPSGVCVADLWTGTIRQVETHTAAAATTGADAHGRALIRSEPDSLECPLLGPVTTEEFRHDALGRPLVVTRLSAGPGMGEFLGFGTGETREHARRVSTFEALERYQLAHPAPDCTLTRAPYRELGDAAVDPTTLGFGACTAGAAADPRSTPLHWVAAWSCREQRAVLVPAQDVWLQSPLLPAEPIFVQSTTNGAALGSTFAEAATHAVLEAVERDAYLAAWYLRRPLPLVSSRSSRSGVAQIAGALATHRIECFDMTTDTRIPACLAVATARGGDRAVRHVHATACSLQPDDAARSALLGIAMNTLTLSDEKWRAYEDYGASMDRIHEAEAHYAIHAVGAASGGAAFLGGGSAQADALVPPPFPPRFDSPAHAWALVTERVLQVVQDILVVDVTHAEIRARGLHCVKVLVPGLFPLWFGAGWRRVQITPRLQSLAAAWRVPVPEQVSDLNQELHALG